MRTSFFRLFAAFVIAFILTIVPLPDILVHIRPSWILLLQFYLPDSFSVGILIIVGLFLDSFLSTTIGEHIFALCLVSWIASNKTRRFSFYTIMQQMALIGCFIFIYQVAILVIDAFFGYKTNIIYSTILSIFLWPWMRLIMEECLLVRKELRRS